MQQSYLAPLLAGDETEPTKKLILAMKVGDDDEDEEDKVVEEEEEGFEAMERKSLAGSEVSVVVLRR